MTDRDTVDRGVGEGGALLRLLAVDAEDLSVVSAHLQDARVRWADMAFQPTERRFVLLADRFDWCAADVGRMERLPAGLHFDGVIKASFQGRKVGAADDETLNLLSISFQETDKPAGIVFLTFSEGAAIRLDVECLEGQLRDLGPRRPVAEKPGHAENAVDDMR
jgi:hypothetical protein